MLILVPTRAEAAHLFDGPIPVEAGVRTTHVGGVTVRAALVGFGPIAAAALATRALGETSGETVCLAGLAGTYQPGILPVGALLVGTEAICADVGRGRAGTFLGPEALGLPQVPARDDRPAVYERLPLAQLAPNRPTQGVRGPLLTVSRASASPAEAALCQAAHPDALAEEMEGFAVALAAREAGRSLLVLRGISNVAGDVDRAAWRVEEALAAVLEGLLDLLA